MVDQVPHDMKCFLFDFLSWFHWDVRLVKKGSCGFSLPVPGQGKRHRQPCLVLEMCCAIFRMGATFYLLPTLMLSKGRRPIMNIVVFIVWSKPYLLGLWHSFMCFRRPRTSFLRSHIHPCCGCFMVVFMGRPQYNAQGLLFLFIPVNQSGILQDLSHLFVATFQSQCLMVC